MRIACVVIVLLLAAGLRGQEQATAPLYDGRTPFVVELDHGDTLLRDGFWFGPDTEHALFARLVSDAAYRSHDDDGVLVIRPASAWEDRHNPLNSPVGNITWNEVTQRDVEDRVARLLWPWMSAPSKVVPASTTESRMSLAVRSGTILDVIVAAARTYGNVWSVVHWTPGERIDFDDTCLWYRPVRVVWEELRARRTVIPFGATCPSPSPRSPLRKRAVVVSLN